MMALGEVYSLLASALLPQLNPMMILKRLLQYAFLGETLVAASPVAKAAAANPSVTIASGVVIGTATGVANQPAQTNLVHAYLGVPFASSPPLRFAPPEPPQSWSSPLVAQQLPPACVQQFIGSGSFIQGNIEYYFNNPGYAPPAESEDCLYLNIYTPKDANPSSLKPVMFWVFGGNLQFGTGSLTFYNGSSLAANEDVIVVSPNYRTNIFGFSGSPELPPGQLNAGFLDQRMALEWVQQNIKEFGGDPSRVTIFGESAGGYSIKQLVAAAPNPLTFHAAILESQGAVLPVPNATAYEITASHFNCTNSSSTLECLRQVPATDIKQYIESQSLTFPVAKDGVTAVENVEQSLTTGQAADVPILIGTNANEFSVFLAILDANNGTAALQEVLRILNITDSAPIDAALTVLGSSFADVPFNVVSRIVTDLIFTCSTSILATQFAKSGRPTWRYQYHGDFPNVELAPDFGAYHTSEIPEVWGTYPLKNSLGSATPAQIGLSAYMQKAWTDFGKNPSSGPGWPAIGTAGGVELGNLGLNGKNETTGPLIAADALCPILGPVGLAAGFTD